MRWRKTALPHATPKLNRRGETEPVSLELLFAYPFGTRRNEARPPVPSLEWIGAQTGTPGFSAGKRQNLR
jgi:hypothetical protein